MSQLLGAIGGMGAGIGGSVANWIGTKAGLSATENATNSLQGLDIDALNALASKQDIAKYKLDFEEQAKVDPTYSALRQQGGKTIQDALLASRNVNSPQNVGLRDLTTAATANEKINQSTIQDLLTQARAELAAGATLPPAFQAEMIRSGLAAGGAAGTGIAGEGATGVGVRTLMGSAGLQLVQQRQAQAEGLAGSAQSLQAQQEAALAELTQVSQSVNSQKAGLGQMAANLGLATIPSIGMGGANDVSMSIANTNLENAKKLSIGQQKAAGDAATGQMWSGVMSSIGGAMSGGAGGGAMSGGAGGGGGTSGILGGLMSYFNKPGIGTGAGYPGAVG